VRAAGGRALVVTAKYEPSARLHLEHLGIEPDELIGGLWAERKAEALLAHGAGVYVGDHLGDIRGARAARALSVAVATGPCTAEELRAAGADVVLPDLTAFPAWLREYGEASDPAA
jgi:phosphoglycolate phosphatase